MTFDMVLMLMGWPYNSFDCLSNRTKHGLYLGQIIKILQKEGLTKLLQLIILWEGWWRCLKTPKGDYVIFKKLQTQPKTRKGDLTVRDPFVFFKGWYRTLFGHIGPILNNLDHSVCLDPSIWTSLFGPIYWDLSIWTCLLSPVYLDLSLLAPPIWTSLFALDLLSWVHIMGPVYLESSIWTCLFGSVYLDPSIEACMFRLVCLDPSI